MVERPRLDGERERPGGQMQPGPRGPHSDAQRRTETHLTKKSRRVSKSETLRYRLVSSLTAALKGGEEQ